MFGGLSPEPRPAAVAHGPQAADNSYHLVNHQPPASTIPGPAFFPAAAKIAPVPSANGLRHAATPRRRHCGCTRRQSRRPPSRRRPDAPPARSQRASACREKDARSPEPTCRGLGPAAPLPWTMIRWPKALAKADVWPTPSKHSRKAAAGSPYPGKMATVRPFPEPARSGRRDRAGATWAFAAFPAVRRSRTWAIGWRSCRPAGTSAPGLGPVSRSELGHRATAGSRQRLGLAGPNLGSPVILEPDFAVAARTLALQVFQFFRGHPCLEGLELVVLDFLAGFAPALQFPQRPCRPPPPPGTRTGDGPAARPTGPGR